MRPVTVIRETANGMFKSGQYIHVILGSSCVVSCI